MTWDLKLKNKQTEFWGLLFSKPMMYKKSFLPRLQSLGENIGIYCYMDTSINIVVGTNQAPRSGGFSPMSPQNATVNCDKFAVSP